MYALKRKAIEEEIYPSRFAIPVLDKEMSKLIAKYGRNSELWLVLSMYLKSKNILGLLKMAPTGLSMIKTGRMRLRKEKIKNRKQLQSLSKAVKEGTQWTGISIIQGVH